MSMELSYYRIFLTTDTTRGTMVSIETGSHEAVNLIGGIVNAIADVLRDVATALMGLAALVALVITLWAFGRED